MEQIIQKKDGMSNEEMRFKFGKNWDKYVRNNFSEERVAISQKHILVFLRVNSLESKCFLDIGCGSGLHSLAALRAGAAKVVSFDYDWDSVHATQRIKAYAGDPERWVVMQGSILDNDFLKNIEPADIVYSWGVLHHTGAMWKAVENTARLMKATGVMYIALYDDLLYFGKTRQFWLDIKQKYNRAGWLGKKRMEWWYFWEFFLQRTLRNIPIVIKQAKEYKKSRGMDMYRDAVDWLGGWPMEYASVEEVKAFADKLELELINLVSGQANAEYLFKKKVRL
jgi:SAM-dependent methyltransferase